MTDRGRRRRLIRACAGAASLELHRGQVRGVEHMVDHPGMPALLELAPAPRRRRRARR